MKSDLFHDVARAYYGISPELYALSQKYAAKSMPGQTNLFDNPKGNAAETEEGKAAASPKKADSKKRSSKKTDSKAVNPNFPPPKKQPKSSPGQMNLPFGSGAPKPDTNVTQPAKKKSSAEILSEIEERERREQKSQKEIPGLEGSHNKFAAARRKESLGYEPDEDVLSMLDDDSLGVQRLSSKAFAAQDSIANDETANKAQQMHADAMDAHESMAESFRDDAWSYGADLNEISELDPDDWEDLPEDAREALEIAMHHDLMAEKHAAYMRENEKKYPTPVRAPKTPYALGDAQFTGTGEPAPYALPDAKAKAKRWKRPRGKKGKLPEKNCATACK